MKLNSPTALLHNELKDIFNGESQLVKALPKMAKGASSHELQHAFTSHLKETKGQVRRLREVGRMLGMKLPGKKCKGMEGLVEEGEEVIKGGGDEAIVDLALIAGAQRVEHYEIATYTSLVKLAQELGQSDAAALLQENLDEEVATNEKLAALSEELTPPVDLEEHNRNGRRRRR